MSVLQHLTPPKRFVWTAQQVVNAATTPISDRAPLLGVDMRALKVALSSEHHDFASLRRRAVRRPRSPSGRLWPH